MQNINREADNIFIEIDNLIRYKDRMYEAIHRGSVFVSSSYYNTYTFRVRSIILLDDTKGIKNH